MVASSVYPVQTRVISPETHDSLPLVDEVCSFAERHAKGSIAILGGYGAGKTYALQVLGRAELPVTNVVLLDEPRDSLLSWHTACPQLVIYTSQPSDAHEPRYRRTANLSLHLAPWNDDELIEYLLATHPQQCGDIMRRVHQDKCRSQLRGSPQLWTLVLERMAHDPSATDIREILKTEIYALCQNASAVQQVNRGCFDALVRHGSGELPEQRGLVEQVRLYLRHRLVQILLAAEHVVLGIDSGDPRCLHWLPPDLLREVATAVSGNVLRIRQLSTWGSEQPQLQSTVVSLLHAAQSTWLPPNPPAPNLSRAFLPGGINWEQANLAGAVLTESHLPGARLSRSYLKEAQLVGANLHRAILVEAILDHALASHANFTHADLRQVRAECAVFRQAILAGADLQHALLLKADFSGADLRGACFQTANLAHATMVNCEWEDADLRNANLRAARLRQANFRDCLLAGTCFAQADLTGSNFEEVEFPGAQFEQARLIGSLFTGSVMPQANFAKAILCDCGLADVQWEGADLREADLRRSSFHLGSTRSGLVGSPYPGHGSKTGFYTDDYDQQHYKAPEEIRKANLCRADLRGARVDNVDFYLVDLRGAKYDRHQAQHFRRCGALLDDKS